MHTIWKFPIDHGQRQITVPALTKFLSADIQHGVICLWGVVPDPKAEQITRLVQIVGTGHQFDPAPMAFIGTVQQAGGDLIWHVWAQQ